MASRPPVKMAHQQSPVTIASHIRSHRDLMEFHFVEDPGERQPATQPVIHDQNPRLLASPVEVVEKSRWGPLDAEGFPDEGADSLHVGLGEGTNEGISHGRLTYP